MFVSIMRLSVLVLTMIALISFVTLTVHGAETQPPEIILREDGMLQSSVYSLVAGLGAAICVGLVFVIVWKQWEL